MRTILEYLKKRDKQQYNVNYDFGQEDIDVGDRVVMKSEEWFDKHPDIRRKNNLSKADVKRFGGQTLVVGDIRIEWNGDYLIFYLKDSDESNHVSCVVQSSAIDGIVKKQ